ncbi:MAG: DUF5777 family beta-barrel protein [Candidatus Cloacimonetes bacterium]|nr:DUF5777 family beta-barrel protein [Candidatus Cloacimonadota bacterium]
MKQIAICCILIGVFTVLYGYQNSTFSLFTPTSLNANEGEIHLAHRFYGDVSNEPLDTFFGMNEGANVNIATRYNIIYGIEAKAGYTRASKQYDIGTSYKLSPAEFPLQAQIDLQYFSFVPTVLNERRDNFLYVLSAQSKPLYGVASIAMNAGFDGYYERLINGYGLQLKLSDRISVLGEYYPVWDRKSAAEQVKQYLGKNDAYSFGVKLNTYGHHFMFCLSNGWEFSPARQSMGTSSQNLHFGFNIQRQFGM